jgi:N-methylhydantoinase B
LGRNELQRKGQRKRLPGKTNVRVAVGDVLSVSTPGGGGWGKPR